MKIRIIGLLAAVFCLGGIRAGFAANVVTSSDFANAWNSGASPIIVVGAPLNGTSNYGIVLANALNPFLGASMTINSYSGLPDGTALIMNGYTLAFAPAWGNDMNASISNLTVYGATNGAISFAGNGTGAHSLTVDGTYFYNNATGSDGGAVSVNSQQQSTSDNTYILTDNDYVGNSAINGGAVYMASNNSIYSGAANPNAFSVIDDTGGNHYIAMNRATGSNGGGIYFLANNADGGNVDNQFTAQGYNYYQNYAKGLGGAIYNGVLNGNAPAINDFNILGGVFTQNQATNGGAITNEINGGNTTVNVDIDGSFYSNIAIANGGAIYNAVGDQYSPYGGNITFNITGPFDSNKATNGGAIYNDIQPGQSTVITNIGSSFTNNYASGGGGAIYNTSGNNNPGTSVINIADGTLFFGNGAIYGGAIYNSGNGIINLNAVTNDCTILGNCINFTNNYSSGATNGSDIYQDSATAVINIIGTGTVNIDDGIAGIGTINQDAGTTFNLNQSSFNIYFTGIYNNAAGSTINALGFMFGGENNIGGIANITSAQNSFYFNANMLSNSELNYTTMSTSTVSVGAAAGNSSAGINFEGSGATIGFNAGLGTARYLLQDDISNGQSNQIAFNNSDVTFGSAQYAGSTDYAFYNSSILDLANSSASYQQYNFMNLNTDGTSALSFKIGNDQNQGALAADTINVANEGGTINLGKIYIDDANGIITGLIQIIYGTPLDFINGQQQFIATSNGTYTVTTVNNQYVQLDSVPTTGGGTTSSTVGSNGGTTSTTNNPGGGTTVTTTDPNGGATTTTNNGGGDTTTTTNNPDGSTTVTVSDGSGDTITVTTNPDGSATITQEPSGTVTNIPDGGSGSASLPDGTTVTVGPDGSGGTTTTTTNPDGTTTASTVDPIGSGGTTTTTTPGGGGGSTTTTTDPNGGGSSVTNPDGSTAGTTTTPGGGATGTASNPSVVLVLNDVNALDAAAIAATLSSSAPRAWQVGAGETYLSDTGLAPAATGLDAMASGVFSVHGANAGTVTSVLDGDNLSMFNIESGAVATFTLQDLTVQNAYTAGGGSVINMDDAGSTAILTNLVVQNNRSDGNGGAANIVAGTVYSTDIDYINNHADGDGGAFYNSGTIIKHGGSYVGNSAGGNGGAIANASPVSATPTTIYSGSSTMNFTDNTAGNLGGAIYNEGYLDISVAYGADWVFQGNTDHGGVGGAKRNNDIYNAGTITFTSTGGSLTINGGIAGTAGALIEKHSPAFFILGETADNSGYLGTFNQYNGIVEAYGMFFGGTNNIESGILNWHENATKLDTATLNITGGTINIYGNLRLVDGDNVGPASTLNLYSTGFIDLAGGTLFLDPNDVMLASGGGIGNAAGGGNGLGGAQQSDGYLVATGAGLTVYSAVFEKTGGVTLLENYATGYIRSPAPSGGITGGDIIVSNATLLIQGNSLSVGAGAGTVVPTTGMLAVGDNALIDSIDGTLQTHVFAGKFAIFSALTDPLNSIANFAVDLDAQKFQSDQFVFSGTAMPGELIMQGNGSNIEDIYAMDAIVMLSQINLLNSPRTSVVPFNIMQSPNYDPAIMFAATTDLVYTPAGTYALVSLGDGNYELVLQSAINPAASRTGASANGVMSAQAFLNNTLFDHVFLDSNECLGCEYAPWQFQQHSKAVWAKGYGGSEKLKLGGDVPKLDNNFYGVIAGIDFESQPLGPDKQWRWLPTLYMAYNGGTQKFAGADMNINGAQVGAMSSWSNGDFIGALLAYGGIYNTRIDIDGTTDSVNNWLAGGAGKVAYDVRLNAENIILQPNLLLSYNYIGAQNWDSDYGNIDMASGYLNGLNVAPGLAFIAGLGDSFNVFLSGLYMRNITNDNVNKIGEMEAPALTTPDYYFEYGIGAVGFITEATSLEAKAGLRTSGSVNGFNGHIGISYKF